MAGVWDTDPSFPHRPRPLVTFAPLDARSRASGERPSATRNRAVPLEATRGSVRSLRASCERTGAAGGVDSWRGRLLNIATPFGRPPGGVTGIWHEMCPCTNHATGLAQWLPGTKCAAFSARAPGSWLTWMSGSGCHTATFGSGHGCPGAAAGIGTDLVGTDFAPPSTGFQPPCLRCPLTAQQCTCGAMMRAGNHDLHRHAL